MSGFTGLYRRTGAGVTESELEAMVDAMDHRGPDGRGTWRDGPVGLGHQHLQTTPESKYASLPEASDDGKRVLTMDGRVDNRTALCDALGLDESLTLTDSQLLLAAYDEWGVECFERVVGAFAVVIYDRELGRLVCARDATGIKPFYYTLDDDLFAFGTEPKSICSLPDVPEVVDDASVFAFLTEELHDPEATFFEEISRLPSGQVMVVEAETARTRSYWSLDEIEELDLPSDEAYEERFREVFTEAVRCRLRRPAGTRPASLLSGGLDSTSLACVAQSLLAPEESLKTFSVTHEGYSMSDESEYLQAALDAYDFDSRIVNGGGVSPFIDLDERLAHQDEPFYPALNIVQQLFIDELADENCRVLLDGLGGDQTLHYGTSHLTELLLRGELGRFVTEVDAFAKQIEDSRKRVLFNYVVGPLVPRWVRLAWRHYQGLHEEKYDLIDTDAASDVGFDKSMEEGLGPATDHREEHRRRIRNAEQVYFIEVLDAEFANAGIEPRYPYYDRRLVEFCLALPLDQKIQRGLGRQIMRRAMGDTVPEKILTRTNKARLGQSWLDGLNRHERDELRERLVDSPQFVSRYVDEDVIEGTFERFADDSSPSLDDGWPLVKAYALETWLRNRDKNVVAK